MPRRVVVLLLLAVFVLVSRAWFWTSYSPNFDFANFTLGVIRFAPQDHQPHPPGYPGVVLLAKLLAAAGLTPVRALQWTALLGALAALAGTYLAGRRLAGEAAGLWGAALLAVQPVFWYSGVTSPTRVFLAAGVAWLVYLLPSLRWFPVGAALLAGFRPELPLLFAAPFVISRRRAAVPWPRIFRALVVALVLSLPWVAWLAVCFGSLPRLLYVYYHYFHHHVSTTSALLGAPPAAWQAMLRDTLLWNGPLAFLALARRTRPPAPVLAYLLPALAIQLFVHLAPDAPDHTLGTIAAFAILAGSAEPGWLRAAACPLFLALSLAPPGRLPAGLDILSMRSFSVAQRPAALAIRSLRNSVQPGEAILVQPGSRVPYRVLGPEFPGVPIYYMDPASPAVLYHYRQTPVPGPAPDLSGYRRLHTLR
jgi:hypothetical protein